jgi:KaiC/GvpD/RAD55 family RecA-like ATPase
VSLALLPQFDHDTERAVLGGVLVDGAPGLAVAESAGATWRDFADARHQCLFAAMQQVVKLGQPIDPLTLGSYLERRGALDKAGGRDYLGGLYDEVPHGRNLYAHTKMLKAAAKARAGKDDRAALDVQAAQVGDAQRFLDLGPEAFLRFPWPRLDAAVGGMAPGTMGFLAGHPGGGKTSFLLTLICRLVAAGKRVTYAGLETRPNKLRAQLAARSLGVDPGPIFAGVAQRDPDWPRVREALRAELERQRTDAFWTDHLRFAPHEHIDVRSAVEVMAEAKDFASDLVVIDHIDHVTAEGRSAVAEAHAIVTVFDTATKRHDLVTLAATQTNNEGDVRDPFLVHRPVAPKQIWMGKRKEQVAELFLSVFRPLRREPAVSAEERMAVREGKAPIGPLLAQATTCCHVFKARALGDAKGALVDLGFWNGEVLDEIPWHRAVAARQAAS